MKKTYMVKFIAKDEGDHSEQSVLNVNITVTDVNGIMTVLDFAKYIFRLNKGIGKNFLSNKIESISKVSRWQAADHH